MKHLLTILCILITACAYPLKAASSTFIDYQNFNHGYCPTCNCYPCRCAEMQGEVELDEPYEDCDECGVDEYGVDEVCDAPNPCDQCEEPAPICGTNCGVCLLTVGVVIASLAVAGVIWVTTNTGSSH